MMREIFYIIVTVAALITFAQAQTVMTREEAALYALRAAKALNTSIRWLSTNELPTGEEVANTESDKIDAYALMGFNCEDIVSINTNSYESHWLKEVNYCYPAENGYIFVNAFSGTVTARGEFPTSIFGPIDETQAETIAFRVINSFYGDVDHEWKVFAVYRQADRDIVVYFHSSKLSISLKLGRCRPWVVISPEGFINEVFFESLFDDIIPSITLAQAKQRVVDALEEAYTTGKETYFSCGMSKFKLPKVRFVSFEKHLEAVEAPGEFLIYPIPEEGLYHYEDDAFLQPTYVYIVWATVELIESSVELIEAFGETGKVWTCYIVNAQTGEVEGLGLSDFEWWHYGVNPQNIHEVARRLSVNFLVLNGRELRVANTLFRNSRVYICQEYLPSFGVWLQNDRLYGCKGVVYLNKGEIHRVSDKIYVSLRRVCEVSGIRLWWDNKRKVPVLRAEWLEAKKLLAQKQR